MKTVQSIDYRLLRLARSGQGELVVHDMLGREIIVLADGEQAAGGHEIAADVGSLPGGVDFYTPRADHYRTNYSMPVAK